MFKDIFGKRKTRCSVCGCYFMPDKQTVYIVEEPRSAIELITVAPMYFSAVDCPRCGCQILLASRAQRVDDANEEVQ